MTLVSDVPRLAPAAAEPTVAAQAVGATKIYGTGDGAVVALDHVDVSFLAGAFTAIMGPSGSGKSTLMHCLAGLDELTSGQVLIGDVDLTTLRDKDLTLLRRDKVGFIFQAYNLIRDADRAGEHHPPDGPRPARTGQSLARPSRRHHRPAGPARASPERALWRPATASRGGAGAGRTAGDHLR